MIKNVIFYDVMLLLLLFLYSRNIYTCSLKQIIFEYDNKNTEEENPFYPDTIRDIGVEGSLFQYFFTSINIPVKICFCMTFQDFFFFVNFFFLFIHYVFLYFTIRNIIVCRPFILFYMLFPYSNDVTFFQNKIKKCCKNWKHTDILKP